MSQLMNILQNLIFAVLVFGFIYIAKRIADWRTTDIDDDYEIEENSNMSIGVRRAGLYLGIAIGMIAPLQSGMSKTLLGDVKEMVVDGVLVLILLFIARFSCDKIILKGIDNDAEAKKGNCAVGIVEFGIYIATGFVLNGSFAGEDGGVLSSLIFFVLGQIMLIVLVLLYEKVTPFKLIAEIKKGNASAGMAIAGILISMGIIMRSALSGNFTGWITDIVGFLISAAAGIVILVVVKLLVDRFFLPNTDLKTEIERDHNLAALILTESIVISFALVISTVI